MTNEPVIASRIRGLSERRRLPRIGKVRLGIQEPNSKGGGTHPVMTDHFVFDDDAPGRTLRAMFGERCTSLPIAFPSDDPDEFARRNLEAWGAGTLKCRGDGELAEALVVVKAFETWAKVVAKSPDTPPPLEMWATTARAGNESRRTRAEPERRTITCFGLGYDGAPPCPMVVGEKPKCSPSLHLQFVIRGYPGLGVFQLDSGSVVNLQRVDDFLAFLAGYTGGRFAMVPLVPRLEPYAMKGRTYYGLQLDVDVEALRAGGLRALPGVGELTIAERVTRYLPEPSQQPAAAPAVPVADEAPSDAPDVELADSSAASEDADDAPSDVEVDLDDPPDEVTPGGAHVEACACGESADAAVHQASNAQGHPFGAGVRSAPAERDPRLGVFADVGDFLTRVRAETGLARPAVHQLAGIPASAAAAQLLEYDGGLDALYRAAARAAGAQPALLGADGGAR